MHHLKILEPEKLMYLKADSNYTYMHFKDGKMAVSGFTLKHHQCKSELAGFIRVNRAYLLNPRFIIKYHKIGAHIEIIMSDGTQTRVSKRRLNVLP